MLSYAPRIVSSKLYSKYWHTDIYIGEYICVFSVVTIKTVAYTRTKMLLSVSVSLYKDNGKSILKSNIILAVAF